MPARMYDGLDAAALARLTGAPAVHLFDSVPTVMDIAHQLAGLGTANGTLVLADEQTAGRGRVGRRWHSPPGAGIWAAVVLRPREAPAGGVLPIRTGRAVVESLGAAAPRLRAGLKWPNDVVAGGRKLGGVLCEARWQGERQSWVVAGIGLNVRGPAAPEVRDLAAAVSDMDPSATRLGILEALIPRVTALADAPATLAEAEQAAYLALLAARPGEDVAGIAADGALLVREADGTITRRVDAA